MPQNWKTLEGTDPPILADAFGTANPAHHNESACATGHNTINALRMARLVLGIVTLILLVAADEPSAMAGASS